jgi:hypothetical protein
MGHYRGFKRFLASFRWVGRRKGARLILEGLRNGAQLAQGKGYDHEHR